jgi:hypothetical protein
MFSWTSVESPVRLGVAAIQGPRCCMAPAKNNSPCFESMSFRKRVAGPSKSLRTGAGRLDLVKMITTSRPRTGDEVGMNHL